MIKTPDPKPERRKPVWPKQQDALARAADAEVAAAPSVPEVPEVPEDRAFTLRIAPLLHETIAALAKENRRSLNSETTLLIEEAMTVRGKWPPPKAKKKDWLK
jgi:hypothetical protein